MICSTFMGVLVWSSGSSSNFLLMMVMASGSIGTDVKSAETSYEVTHSPGCNLIKFIKNNNFPTQFQLAGRMNIFSHT